MGTAKRILFCGILSQLVVDSVSGGPGTIDSRFPTNINGMVYALAKQVDGKILVGGFFTDFAGFSQQKLLRLNSDGTPDEAFRPKIEYGGVTAVWVQSDTKILIAGSFTKVSAIGRFGVARLHADGTPDLDFDPGSGPSGPAGGNVLALAVQIDQKVLVGGYFTNLAGFKRTLIARLNEDGSVDESFHPELTLRQGNAPAIRALAIQPDGKILLAGDFLAINGAPRHYLARLNPDGSHDPSFYPDSWLRSNTPPESLLLEPEGTLLAGGYRTYRVYSNGHADGPINPALPQGGEWRNTQCLAIQNDGKLLIGGSYWDGHSNFGGVSRLTKGGSRDSAFTFFSTPFQCTVAAMVVQGDGSVLIGGGEQGGTGYIARLHGDSPSIAVHPLSQRVLPGANVTFSVTADANGMLYYDWSKDGHAVTGAHSSSLTITNVQVEHTGSYSVAVWNQFGRTTSIAASLALYGAPEIYADGELVNGEISRKFQTKVSIVSPLTGGYIFYTVDGTAPSLSSALYTGPMSITNSTTLRALALSQDLLRVIPSPSARIRMLKHTLFTSGGGGYVSASPSQSLYEDGSVVTLTAYPESGWSFAEWQWGAVGNSNPVAVAVTSNLEVQAVFTTTVLTNAVGGGTIRVSPAGAVPYGTRVRLRAIPDPGNLFLVWGGDLSGDSNPNELTITTGTLLVAAMFIVGPAGTPSITLQPISRCAFSGSDIMFTVLASGSHALAYQWRSNSIPLPAATNSVLSLEHVSPTHAADYDVLVKGDAGAVVSAAARLVVWDFAFNGEAVVTVAGREGTPIRVERNDGPGSPGWVTLTNCLLPSDPLLVRDPASTHAQQCFYRMVLLP